MEGCEGEGEGGGGELPAHGIVGTAYVVYQRWVFT